MGVPMEAPIQSPSVAAASPAVGGAPGLAERLQAARTGGSLLPDGALAGLGLDESYRLAALTDAGRVESGDDPRGWKIGFTNRQIWPRYGVHQPIWARVWTSTLTLLEGDTAEVSLRGLVQPRIEPEIVFGFARAPQHGMDDDALFGCLDWVAHGVEIVHTHLDGWRFASAAEPVADFGLHGRLVVGPRRALARPGRTSGAGADGSDFAMATAAGLSAALADLTMELRQDGRLVDQGLGAQVLDGPYSALQQWLQAMAVHTPDRRVRAGDVVTTGTITDAWPVAPGEVWSTHPGDTRWPGLRLRFTA